MKLFSKEAQQTLSSQVCLKSRDVDICVLNTLDGSMPKDYVLDCMMMYQNKDGGFGNGLYIDNYNTNSSVYQVYEAFRLLEMSGFDKTCEDKMYLDIINKAGNYLYNRCVMKDNKWNPNVKSNDDFAHSELFSFTKENEELFGYHPTIDLIGYSLVLFKETKAYYNKAMKIARRIIDDFYKLDKLSKYEIMGFSNFLRMISKLGLFTEDQKRISDKLTEYAEAMISLDFSDDELHPLDVMNLHSKKLDEARELELDYLVDSVAKFGMWDYNKGWGSERYPEADSAMLKWLGAVAVNNFYKLKECKRIEE
ncbi:MAG: hypothetical protein IJU60_06920 [Acholeplasmatales bacterium]|nr:hypothetical protein [Acholeplasmatales bacterium]